MSTTPTQRSDAWHKVWERKYADASEKPLHVVDGFDSLSEEQWFSLVAAFKKLIGPTAGLDVLEVGCGAGAFAQYFSECQSFAGIDYSAAAITSISQRFNGDFRVAEAAALPYPNQSFDVVMCFSVFFYFDSFEYAERVLEEMYRTRKPGGVLFVGEVNDAAKQDLYHSIRAGERRDARSLVKDAITTHLFYEKSFFETFAKRKNLRISITDEDSMELPYYTSSRYRYSVKMY